MSHVEEGALPQCSEASSGTGQLTEAGAEHTRLNPVKGTLVSFKRVPRGRKG